LHGIPLKFGNIVRPLLFADRHSIDHYIKSHTIKYREDASNASDDYLRNAIRHHIVPRLNKLVQSVDDQFYKVSENIKEYELLADYFFKKTWNDLTKKHGSDVLISPSIYEQIPEHLLSSFLFFNLKNFGFSKSQCENLSASKNATIGFELLCDDYCIIKERNGYILQKRRRIEKNFIKISKKIKVAHLNDLIFDFQIVKNSKLNLRQEGCLYFDLSKITYPLKLRYWEAGDKIQILGMKGRKNVSDILTDRKIPNAKRQYQVILENKNGEILAVFPNTVSELSKVDMDSVEVLRIQFKQIDL
jgi:tRNA(Ile)-lysidine synthase